MNPDLTHMDMKGHRLVLWFLVLMSASAAPAEDITTGSIWKYFIGTQEATVPVAAWRSPTFDDSTWLSGRAPIGYANPANDLNGYEATIQTVLPNANPNTWTSVYFRKTFNISDPALIS